MLLLVVCLFGAVAAEQECFLSRDTGDSSCGEAGAQKFFFDHITKRCQPFYYKGCGGNENKFASKDECMTKCGTAKESDAPQTEAVCASGAYAAGATSGRPDACSSCPKGYKCENELCCPQKEHLCRLQYDAGTFGASGHHTPRYFYSVNYKNCMLFTFYGRNGNANNFATYNECKAMCM